MITGHTRMGCLLGSPVGHSLSPAMYNESFRLMGLDFCYLCFDIMPEQLKETLSALRLMNVYGFNVTMPDKTAVMEYLDEISPEARLIGAVNTVHHTGGRLVGYNTDGMGYVKSVREAGIDIRGKEMVLLGAGGAASSVAVQAALDGAGVIHLVNRKGKSWNRAQDLVRRINENTGCRADLTDLEDTGQVLSMARRSVLLTNATSAGMSPDTDGCALPEDFPFPSKLAVSDLIYNPRRTRLMELAERRGCRTFNGLDMLLWQGEAALRIWTGQQMPVEKVREKLFGG